MATTLKLKKRPISDFVNFPLKLLREVMMSGDKDALWDLCSPVLSGDLTVHDKRWLELLIDWAPEGGQPLSRSAPWFKLAARVAEIDPEREGEFTLSQYQTELVWGRMTNPGFKVDSLPSAFIGFIVDFQEVTGRHFAEEEPDAPNSTAGL
jgi:hypothetical protein